MICSYGCGSPALFFLGNKKKPCCQSTIQQCPYVKSQRHQVTKAPSGSVCFYCSSPALHLLGKKQTPCCHSRLFECPEYRVLLKTRDKGGRKKGCKIKSAPLAPGSLCYYCNSPALYTVGNKQTPCCSSSLYSCSGIGKMKKRKVQVCLDIVLCSYGCGSIAKYLIGKDAAPCCKEDCNMCDGTKEKRLNTVVSKWGVSSTFLNPEIKSKISISFGKRELFILPSGKFLNLQGYEPQVLNYLLNTKYNESDFDFDNRPTICYIDPISGSTKTYFPDFWIPKNKLLLEIKSTYSYSIGYDLNDNVLNMVKAEAARASGYDFKFIIWDKGQVLEDSLELWKLNHLIAKRRMLIFNDRGYQRHVREIYNIIDPRTIIGLQQAQVIEISRKEAEDIILKYEWLQTMPSSILASYGLKVGDEILGAVCFSPAPGKAGQLFEEGVNNKTVCLSRGACVHYAHRNAGSFLVSHACKLASKEHGWGSIIAYSDSEAGEIGTIYQACNWLYLGQDSSNYHYDYLSPCGTKLVTSYTLNHDTKRRLLTELGWVLGEPMRPFLRKKGWTEIRREGKKKWVWLADRKTRNKLRFPVIADGVENPYPKRQNEKREVSPFIVPLPYVKEKNSRALKAAWKKRKERGDKFSFSTPVPYQGNNLCAYGCGQVAKYLIGKTKVTTPCCQTSNQLCLGYKTARNNAVKVSEGVQLCGYGCGSLAAFLLGDRKKPCCSSRYQECTFMAKKALSSHKGKGGRLKKNAKS